MNHLNAHRFGSNIPPSGLVYDDVDFMWTLRRPNMTVTWSKAVLKVCFASDKTNAKYVFFNGVGEIGLDSPVGDTDQTANGGTLGSFSGTNTIAVLEWIPISPNGSINASMLLLVKGGLANAPLLCENGAMILSNSKPTLSFQKSSIQSLLRKDYVGEIGYDSNYSILTVTENKYALNQGMFLKTGFTDDLILHHDTSAAAKMADIKIGTLNYLIPNIVVDQQRMHLLTYTGINNGQAATSRVFSNNLLQETAYGFSNYTNVGLIVGGEDSNEERIFRGNISEIIIIDNDVNASKGDWFTDVNNYYQTF